MPTNRKPKSRIGEINSGRILDAALSVFAHHGFSGARLDEIAEAAGMSKPNLLYYFRSKDELYRAVLTRTLELWLEPLRELDPNGDPRAAFGHYIRRKLDYSRSHPDGSRLFAIEIMQGAPHLAHVLSGELAALFDLKCKLIRAGSQKDGSPTSIRITSCSRSGRRRSTMRISRRRSAR